MNVRLEDVSGTGSWLFDILTYNIPHGRTSHHPAHCSRCSHKARTWMIPSLLGNFLLMVLQTISCFHLSYWFDLWPSHCLSWVQKTQDLSLLPEWGSSKGRKKKEDISTRLFFFLQDHFCPRFSLLYKFNSTQLCIWLYWQTVLFWQQLSVRSDEVLVFLWNLRRCCFQAPCFHSSYVLIANILLWLFLLFSVSFLNK